MAQVVAQPVFPDRLRILEADAVRLGSLVLEMVSIASGIALGGEERLIEKVLGWEREVDSMEQDIVERSITFLGEVQSSPNELLFLSATLFLVNELEKIGDEAAKLAVRVRKLRGEFPFEMSELLREMSTVAQSNLRESLRLYSQYSGAEAQRLIKMDDQVDRLYKTSRRLLLGMMRQEPDRSRQFLRCLEIFHALEHVSDRASDIAKRMRNCYEPFVKVLLTDHGSQPPLPASRV